MSHPSGRPYTDYERRAIVAEARATARILLEKIELLAKLEAEYGGEAAQNERGDTAGSR